MPSSFTLPGSPDGTVRDAGGLTTMRRLLFVDDDVAILRALERLLRTRRPHWECAFSDDPGTALDLVESFAPDAVVSDMLMPGMHGAEFLAAVRQIDADRWGVGG